MNGACLYFRAEPFIVTAIIAWTYLHHAHFRRLGSDSRWYYRTVDGVKQVAALESCAERYRELSHCLTHGKCPLTKGMKDEGYPDFTISKHTDLWKAEKAKDPKLEFGSPVFGNKEWGWNEKWLAHVREHCVKNSARYGKLAKEPDPPAADVTPSTMAAPVTQAAAVVAE